MLVLAQASQTGFGSLINSDNFTGIVICTIVVAAIVSGCIKSVVKSTSRERSRREIAAYIAEGSMSPEQGERLMKAGDQA
jgi:hypothetical protein